MGYIKRNCNNCDKEYQADTRNTKRGWGLCCSKSCAAKLREKSKPTYDKETVERNNRIRAGKMTSKDFLSLPSHRQSYLLEVKGISISKETFKNLSQSEQIKYNYNKWGVDAPNIVNGSGYISCITSEGYRVMDGVAYDEWDDAVYNTDRIDLSAHPHDLDYQKILTKI